MRNPWRSVLLALCAFGVLLCIIQPLENFHTRSGIVLSSAGKPYLQTIVRVMPNSPAARVGLQAGQVLDIAPMSPDDRYRLYNAGYGARPLVLYVVRQSRIVPLRVAMLRYATMNWNVWLAYGGLAWALCFAAFLLIRLPGQRAALTLSALLIGMALPSLLLPANWITPWAWLDATANALSFAGLISLGLLATYALSFARPPSRLRTLVSWLSYAVAFAAACFGIAQVTSQLFGVFDPSSVVFTSRGAVFAIYALPWVLPLAAGVLTAVDARGAERSRFLWAFIPLGLFFVGNFLDSLFVAFFPHIRVAHAANNVLAIIAPLGLTYSLLSRRVLDIGFVLNRAAIFSGVSVVLVGAFVLVEWALSEWMSSASHATNVAISAGVALALGVSMRFVHARVEHVVDNVMFRKRREEEEAIRRMAREAPYITDRATLLSRTVDTLERHAGATSATVLLQSDWSDENDPALVTLRATHDVLDLHNVRTALCGDLAVPMVARGRLLGVLTLGPKQSHEAYSPDDIDAIRHLAHSVAGAIDVFSLKGGGNEVADALNALRFEIASLRSDLKTNAAP